MSRVSRKDKKPDIGDIYRESDKAYDEYEACLTTTIYGETYLDPEKCKARGYDPIKADEEEVERLRLGIEWIERTTKEKGFRAQFEEFLNKVPSKYVDKPKSLACFDDLDDLPKKRNKRKKNVNKNSTPKKRNKGNKNVNEDSKSLACFDDLDDLPKEGNKRNKKLTKTEIRIKASYLVGRKVKLGVKFVKVISVKMNEDGVFLEVEEKMGAEFQHYEIMYQEDMVGV